MRLQMSLNINKIFGSQSPEELKTYCCTHLSLSSLCLFGSTSKELEQIAKNNTIWKQFFKKLYPNLDESLLEGMEVKTMFLLKMKELRKEADTVTGLISNDTIASLISPSISLEKLKTMPSLDRAFLVISGINTNSKQLFTTIAITFGEYLKEQMESLENNPPGPLNNRLLDTKPYQILHHLLETKRGPYKSRTALRFMADTAYMMSTYHATLGQLQMQHAFSKLSITNR